MGRRSRRKIGAGALPAPFRLNAARRWDIITSAMTERKPSEKRNEKTGESPKVEEYRFSTWKKILCGVGVILLVGGGILQLSGVGRGEEAAVSTEGAGQTAFLPPGTEVSRAQNEGPDWSGAMLRGGAGVLLGMAIGYAFRMFLRLAMVVVGGIALCFLIFNHLGWIQVDWESIRTQMAGLSDTLEREFRSFQHFVGGVIPSMGLTGIGAFFGFRRG